MLIVSCCKILAEEKGGGNVSFYPLFFSSELLYALCSVLLQSNLVSGGITNEIVSSQF